MLFFINIEKKLSYEKYLKENLVEIFDEIDARFLWSNNSHARSKMKLLIKIDGNSITLRLCHR